MHLFSGSSFVFESASELVSLPYLGMRNCSNPLRVFPTPDRIQRLSCPLEDFVSSSEQPITSWCSLLGSVLPLVPGSGCPVAHPVPAVSFPLHRGPLGQLSCLLGTTLAAGIFCGGQILQIWPQGCHSTPLYQSSPYSRMRPMPVGGAYLGDVGISGSWSPLQSRFSINHRELLTILLAVQAFLPSLQSSVVAVFYDNTTTLSYLRKEGGGGGHPVPCPQLSCSGATSLVWVPSCDPSASIHSGQAECSSWCP